MASKKSNRPRERELHGRLVVFSNELFGNFGVQAGIQFVQRGERVVLFKIIVDAAYNRLSLYFGVRYTR